MATRRATVDSDTLRLMSTPLAQPKHSPLRGRRGFQAAVLAWYDAQGRSLPFRGTRDPYAILVSETMAQQTQIARVGPAWKAFVDRFPSFEALAEASPADVLRAWQGLGYNRRALNLQRAARAVIEDHGGRLPQDLAALERLPGIGPYTARAVAAIAFDASVGAVDTNVRRVLGRVAAGDIDRMRPGQLQALADSLVPPGRAADWTHALMDVGATFCRTTRPLCEGCPARRSCRYATEASPATGEAKAASQSASGVPFARTSRWLRGRIVDRLCEADGGAWTRFDEPIGTHSSGDVVAMLAVLARDGLLERSLDDPHLARLPHDGPSVGAGG